MLLLFSRKKYTGIFADIILILFVIILAGNFRLNFYLNIFNFSLFCGYSKIKNLWIFC